MDEHDIFKTPPREPLFEVPTTFVEPNNFTNWWPMITHEIFILNNAITIYVDERKDNQENEQRDIHKKG